MSKKSAVYVDGFNLYYGAIKDTKWKWLDLERYFSMLRQDDDIQIIKYFTALIDGSHKPNQEAYLLALTSLQKIEIILGRFKMKNVKCGVRNCSFKGYRFFKMPEEKRTDVNIAIHMLRDALSGQYDRLILVSGDSDLAPAVTMVREITPHIPVIVYVPATDAVRGAAVELRSAASKHRTLPINLFSKAQLPSKVPDGKGGWAVKPSSW